MKIVCFLLKLVLKILLLPVAFLLRFLCFIWNLLMQLSLWVLSPVMLFVLGCGIYSVVRASWTDVFLLTLIEMGLFAAAVGAGGIMELMERLLVEIAEHIDQRDNQKIVEADEAFHDILYRASRNERLQHHPSVR